MKSLRILFILGTIAVFVISALTVLTSLETFDLDEALYRVVAVEMKQSGQYLRSTWEGKPFFHKPPLYYWTIILSSAVLGDEPNQISAAAARLPSFIFTWLTVLLLALSWPKFIPHLGADLQEHFKSRFFPAFIFSLLLYPVFLSSSVLFDPLQTLVLTPSLLIMALYFLQGQMRQGSPSEWLLCGLSLAAGASIKGFQALVVPGFAFVIYSCVSLWRYRSRVNFLADLGFAVKFGLTALIFCGGFFGFLHLWTGPEFTHEFFIVQHFRRGTSVMEDHSGFFGFYILVLLVGAAIFASIAILFTKKIHNSSLFFWAWILSFVGFFSLLSTQLTNYIWPTWPALAMVGAIGLATSTNPAPSRSRRLLAALPVVPWILVFLVLTFLGARWPNLDFLQTPSFELLRDLDPEIPRNLLISACIALSAGVFFLVSLFVRPTVHRVFATGLITQLIWICVLALGILPVAADLLPKAKMRLGAWANENFSNSDCLHILGPRSAAVNLTYRRANISHCKPGDQEWALAPLLSQEKCLSQGMTIEKRDQLMILCKHPKRNPESPL